LSAIKPVNSGSVSIADAIAKAKSIAADRGVQSYDHRQNSATPRGDPRLSGRDYGRERSRSPPRRDSYGANPYRDERREDPRRGGYRRSPSPERNFRGARDPPPGYRSNDGETETIRVKSQLVGLIIGRNGENLKKVEQESGARVQFIQAKDSHVPERQCTISGSLRAREAAKAAIFGIIDENGGQNVMQDKGAYTPGMPGRAKVNLPTLREGERSTQVMVPDKTVGLIIGRGGETIKDLQERSGCHVNIVGENKSVNGLRPVNLIGDDHATQIAKELIMEIVESDVKSSGANQNQQRDRGYDNYNRGSGGGGGNAGGRDWIEKTIKVPSEAVGMIIGKGGETIKELQKTSGCKINVNQPHPPDVTRDIDLAGTARSMAEAERTIWEKVEVVRQRDSAAGRQRGGGGGGGGSGGGYDAYSQQQPSVPGYGQYMPTQQAPPQMPAFQMPLPGQQSTPQQGGQQYGDQSSSNQGWTQEAIYQWYASQMANLGQQPPPAPGTQ
jgi:transcription antitermination factor NusA-like protein